MITDQTYRVHSPSEKSSNLPDSKQNTYHIDMLPIDRIRIIQPDVTSSDTPLTLKKQDKCFQSGKMLSEKSKFHFLEVPPMRNEKGRNSSEKRRSAPCAKWESLPNFTSGEANAFKKRKTSISSLD